MDSSVLNPGFPEAYDRASAKSCFLGEAPEKLNLQIFAYGAAPLNLKIGGHASGGGAKVVQIGSSIWSLLMLTTGVTPLPSSTSSSTGHPLRTDRLHVLQYWSSTGRPLVVHWSHLHSANVPIASSQS